MVLHNGVDGGDQNPCKADRSVDKDVREWIRGAVGVMEVWIDEKCVHIRWRRGDFLESSCWLSEGKRSDPPATTVLYA